MYLPKQVIKNLVRYMNDGCDLEVITEEFNGGQIERWIANNKLILWSAPTHPKKEILHK